MTMILHEVIENFGLIHEEIGEYLSLKTSVFQ